MENLENPRGYRLLQESAGVSKHETFRFIARVLPFQSTRSVSKHENFAPKHECQSTRKAAVSKHETFASKHESCVVAWLGEGRRDNG